MLTAQVSFGSNQVTGHLCGKNIGVRWITWWRHQMETFSALLALCAGNSPVPGEFRAQRPVTRRFDVSFDLRLNKRLSKQSWGWWFEAQTGSLWRHCNEYAFRIYRIVMKIPCQFDNKLVIYEVLQHIWSKWHVFRRQDRVYTPHQALRSVYYEWKCLSRYFYLRCVSFWVSISLAFKTCRHSHCLSSLNLSEIELLTHLPPSAAYMHRWTGPALIRVMTCRLSGAKPLLEPMLQNCQLDPWEQSPVKFESRYKAFHSCKCVSNCRLRNGDHFVQGRWVNALQVHVLHMHTRRTSPCPQVSCWRDMFRASMLYIHQRFAPKSGINNMLPPPPPPPT